MTTTTYYGAWGEHGDGCLTVKDHVTGALGEFAGDYDIDAIIEDYQDAINAALPDGVALSRGVEFYGPYRPDDSDFEGCPRDSDGRLDIKTNRRGRRPVGHRREARSHRRGTLEVVPADDPEPRHLSNGALAGPPRRFQNGKKERAATAGLDPEGTQAGRQPGAQYPSCATTSAMTT